MRFAFGEILTANTSPPSGLCHLLRPLKGKEGVHAVSVHLKIQRETKPTSLTPSLELEGKGTQKVESISNVAILNALRLRFRWQQGAYGCGGG